MDNTHRSTWRVNGFRLEMYHLGRYTTDGHAVVGYRFYDRNVLIFDGDDFYPKVGVNPVGPEAQAALLEFLALSPAEVGEAFFDSYTPKQYRWATSKRGAALRAIMFAR